MKHTENQRIKILRKHLKLSQEKFADSLGIKQGTYSGVELGASPISARSKIIIENLYNVNINWLETGEGEMIKSDGNRSAENSETDVTNNLQSENTDITIETKPKSDMLHLIHKAESDKDIPLKFENYIPVYETDLSQLLNRGDYHAPDAWINHPVFSGCDAVVKAKGDGMEPQISDGYWMGVKKIDWQDYFHSGSIYAIITRQFELLKYVFKSDDPNCLKMVPANTKYSEEHIPKNQILGMWHVRLAVPSGNPKMFV